MDWIVNIPVERQRSLLEMFLTVWSPLTESLDIQAGQTLLMRGGTSSIGLTSVAVAKNAGLTVLATTRNEQKKQAFSFLHHSPYGVKGRGGKAAKAFSKAAFISPALNMSI